MTSLTQVHHVPAADALDVIFVHGLGGEARATWMHDANDPGTLWPGWVGEDAECNVWIAGYGAALSGWDDAAMHLTELGESLFASLQSEQALRGRRVVLIGHSLGGLVIKAGMLQAAGLGDVRRLAVLESIAAVVFVGTPHQGSSLATAADRLRLLLRTNPQVTNMVSDDAWLKLQNDLFRRLYEQRHFAVRVFFETKGVFLGRKFFGLSFGPRQLVVDRNSSDPALSGVNPTGIDGDHLEIAKPKSRQDLAHRALLDFLRDLSTPPSPPAPPSSPPPAPSPHPQPSAPSSLESPHAAPPHPLALMQPPELLTRMRNASMPLLSWPSTLPDGTWLPRPELELLKTEIAIEAASTHLLLGEPGSGKSSLLVRLAHDQAAAGWVVLAIKADRLSPDVLDRDALSRYLNLGTDPATAVRELASQGPVLVVIDQVDALADLVVQHSARLRVLLDLVQDLSDASGVHTVLSCRTFEQRHDPALRNLGAVVVHLALPEWPTVSEALSVRGLQTDSWNHDLKEVLRSPHALEIFLSLLDGTTEPAALISFQGLLERQWKTRVLVDASGKRKATLHHLAKLMAEREVLGLPLVAVEDRYAHIQELVAAGMLRLDEGIGRVEFRHQTLYEFVRARSFLEEAGSLTEAVRAQQASLRIRPQLWHALGYFREASPEDYGREIRQLWAANLRPHLKMLLIEFLGRQTAPTAAERVLAEGALADAWFFPRFLGASAGSPGWFTMLAPAHIPRLMSRAEEPPAVLLFWLRQALHFEAEAVVNLVVDYWIHHPTRDALSWHVLGGGEVAPQSGKWFDSLIVILMRTPIADWAAAHLAAIVSVTLPDDATKIVATWFAQQIDAAESASVQRSQNGANAIEKIQSIVETQRFHDIETIADAAPKAFVVNMWPVLVKALVLCQQEGSQTVRAYRPSRGLMFQALSDDERPQSRPLLRALALAVEAWADQDAVGYLDFAEANVESELLVLHRLLAVGFVKATTSFPMRVHEYLVADPRRLALGSYTDVHKESIDLIRAVGSLCAGPAFEQLENSLLGWQYYLPPAEADDAATRQRRLQSSRQHRLRLLRALPPERRSAAVARLIQEEERAFPGLHGRDVVFSGVHAIGSPVTAEQMARASDADILNLFEELTDESAWDHPRHSMKGGAIQAAQQLAELAKADMGKTLRILQQLEPGRNEVPVGSVLRNLVPAGLSEAALYGLIADLEDRGFRGPSFRRDAAEAVSGAASETSPVPDALLTRMELWLVPGEAEPSNDRENGVGELSSPILWDNRSLSILPDGNYPVLAALSGACLASQPRRIKLWLGILERHLTREESQEIWEALLGRELLNLRLANTSRAEALIDHVLHAVPAVVNSDPWVHFVAHAYDWASAVSVQRWVLHTLRESKDAAGAGELIGLRHARFPAEGWARDLAYSLEGDARSGAVIGLAHAVSHLWHLPATRSTMHPLLIQLLKSGDESMLLALSAIFLHNGLGHDPETQAVLEAVVEHPRILTFGSAESLPKSLSKLVEIEPHRVCRVANSLLDIAGEKMGNITTSWYLSTEWLLDIALKLQDMEPAERAEGSALFERMLEFNMPQAVDMTLELDKRTPTGMRQPPAARRKSISRPPRRRSNGL